jgi:hypothetical protein
MSSFLFGRNSASERSRDGARERADGPDVEASLQAMVEIQSITASAIFAILVSKGVMSAGEAAAYMADVAKVLERDVKSEFGAKAGQMLGSYGQALVAADG